MVSEQTLKLMNERVADAIARNNGPRAVMILKTYWPRVIADLKLLHNGIEAHDEMFSAGPQAGTVASGDASKDETVIVPGPKKKRAKKASKREAPDGSTAVPGVTSYPGKKKPGKTARKKKAKRGGGEDAG